MKSGVLMIIHIYAKVSICKMPVIMSNKHYTCPFSHLILSGRCGCAFSAKDCIAEKEFGACLDESASGDCASLYQNLRSNSDFALKSHHQSNLSVGQQAKIKMGGLLALQEIIHQSSENNIKDIATLVEKIKSKYANFDKLPFSKLMPKISQFKFRVR
ncbi:MAG: hypothetical protein Ctma_0250 [Catillopecten margaritatus gill symbiont]|uniref:Uncharacterized protein n=1 Tax=Catillopecten margaritatus gill symbiont TaxID=3083288 RepID=A0AAU6PEX8_9GAMM